MDKIILVNVLLMSFQIASSFLPTFFWREGGYDDVVLLYKCTSRVAGDKILTPEALKGPQRKPLFQNGLNIRHL